MTKKSFLHDLRAAAAANFLPAMGLQFVALFVLWAYRFWPGAQFFLNQVGRFKHDIGFEFAFVTSALAGAVLPLALQGLQRGAHRRIPLTALPVLLLFWGLRGCIVDILYQYQSIAWGDNALLQTLAIKVFCDLGIFTPLIGIPTVALMFAWLDANGNSERFLVNFERGLIAWFKRDVWPLVPMAWVVWLPALMVIYALPVDLQLPISIIIQCFWALFLVVLTDKKPIVLQPPIRSAKS
jgi:hypothetical protein